MNCFLKLHHHCFKEITTAHTRGLTERSRSHFSISCFLLRLIQDVFRCILYIYTSKCCPRGYALIFLTYSLLPRGTQIPYSAAVDLVAGLGVSHT
ncbi:hypothetical protein M9H77_13482 [Catharanthus roseus]|uniref:Uncharacterized protein n=1 Tax=Catharanthus roseus TaxID=4058 RepID=A0ACC0BKJ2_CATRO|nr:hypothetical protein M9H77_13482 [Catharanthus roseus]